MMTQAERDKLRFKDVLDEISLIREGISDTTRAEFLSSADKKTTIAHHLTVIGEAASRVRDKIREKYGNRLIESLAPELALRLGKSLDARKLRRIRQLQLTYPIRDALSHELGWTHYRILIGIQYEKARLWHRHETANEICSTRQLQRLIAVRYYKRTKASADKIHLRVANRRETNRDAARTTTAGSST